MVYNADTSVILELNVAIAWRRGGLSESAKLAGMRMQYVWTVVQAADVLGQEC
jgi:hypothetical protein